MRVIAGLWVLAALVAVAGCGSQAATAPGNNTETGRRFHNPILPGFYPDPAIVRVGEDYYEVNSTFEYYPGIPIFHSKDLVNWEQIGSVLDRPSQLPLDKVKASEGVFAPTISYHAGTYYVANLMVNGLGTFIVTATNPTGPWSESHQIKGAAGIDPALFFDEDGTAWYVANEDVTGGAAYEGEHEIWVQRIDLKHFSLIGEKTIVERGGAVKQAVWCEGPHVYKKDGWYYLLISEAGTSEEHAISVSRSKTITGPYELDKRNPIFTHRMLGKGYPVQCVGHGDLVETQNREWWMVCLATRPYGGGMDYNLGRETFLAPVTWEEGWPVVAAGVGHLEITGRAPNLPEHVWAKGAARTEFVGEKLGQEWEFLRTPRSAWWSLTRRPGWLRMGLRPEQVTEVANPSWIGRRQQDMDFAATVKMEFAPGAENEAAGLTVVLSDRNQYRFVETMKEGGLCVRVVKREGGKEQVVGEAAVEGGAVELRVSAVMQDYSFAVRQGIGEWKTVAVGDGRVLTTRASWGFTGVMLGMYATSAGKGSRNHADFAWFEYEGRDAR